MSRLWIAAALTPALVACGTKETDTTGSDDTGMPTMTDSDTMPMGTPSEDEILALVTDDFANYSGWNQITGWEGVIASAAVAHGAFVQIWYNDTAIANLATPEDGASSFKEGYSTDAGGTPDAVTAMRYVHGYGWFYAMFGSDGTVLTSGRDAMCIGCHEPGTGSDGFLAP